MRNLLFVCFFALFFVACNGPQPAPTPAFPTPVAQAPALTPIPAPTSALAPTMAPKCEWLPFTGELANVKAVTPISGDTAFFGLEAPIDGATVGKIEGEKVSLLNCPNVDFSFVNKIASGPDGLLAIAFDAPNSGVPGLILIDRLGTPTAFFDRENGGPVLDYRFYDVIFLEQDLLGLCSYDNGFSTLDLATGQETRVNDGRCHALLQTPTGVLVGGFGDYPNDGLLFCLAPLQPGTCKKINPSDGVEAVRGLYMDGSKLFAAHKGGLDLFDLLEGEPASLEWAPTRLFEGEVWRAAVISEDQFYLVLPGDKLFCQPAPCPAGLPTEGVKGLSISPEGILWVGSSSGLTHAQVK